MSRGRRSALLGAFPLVVVLASAVGIAYLGAVSYLADRGLVAAKTEEQNELARRAARAVTAELELALTAVADTVRVAAGEDGSHAGLDVAALEQLAVQQPVTAGAFFVDSDGRLRYPSPDLTSPIDAAPDQEFVALLARAEPLPPRRQAQMRVARRLERSLCTKRPCQPDTNAVWEARRAYAGLARYRDSGPEALLGLARVERVARRPTQAASVYRELERRFKDRADPDGMPYGLLALLGLSEVSSDVEPLFDVLDSLMSGRLTLSRPAQEAVMDHVLERLRQVELDADEAQRVQTIERRVRSAREAAVMARRLADDLVRVSQTADRRLRGRSATGSTDRSLIYQRLPSGGVVGVALDSEDLEELAARATPVRERDVGIRAAIMPVGSEPPEDERALASASLSPALPHLGLVLVQERSRPDPVAAMVRERGRRHMLLTSGLVALLLIGLFATFRGARRERELARLKSDFVSTVSHELKTPLTSIRMFAEMLREGVAGDDRARERRYHEIIVKESERLGLLIANLLDYAQIEKGTRRYQPTQESARSIAREALVTFSRLREGEGQPVSLSVDPQAESVTLRVDREVTVQALLNLLSNAAKYGGEKEAIELRVSRAEDGYVALAVTDRGPGIPKSEHDRIFREFYRAPAAYTSGVEGTGLGLALVKRHVEAQGGTVDVDSEVGKGATFRLVFPAAVSDTDTDTDTDTVSDTVSDTESDTESDSETVSVAESEYPEERAL